MFWLCCPLCCIHMLWWALETENKSSTGIRLCWIIQYRTVKSGGGYIITWYGDLYIITSQNVPQDIISSLMLCLQVMLYPLTTTILTSKYSYFTQLEVLVKKPTIWFINTNPRTTQRFITWETYPGPITYWLNLFIADSIVRQCRIISDTNFKIS